MKTDQTQYDICLDHIERLRGKLTLLQIAFSSYHERDGHDTAENSPFLLDMNEALYDLNARVERLIQRIDPGFEGEYLQGE